jgi:hypothetical protein
VKTFARVRLVLAVAALLTASCSFGATAPSGEPSSGDGATGAQSTSPASTAASTTTELTRDCRPVAGDPPDRFTGADPVMEAVEISRATFPCADHVTIVPAGDPAVAAAAAYAITSGGPLLLMNGDGRVDVAAELERLEPELVTVAGAPGSDAGLLDDYETQRLPTYSSPDRGRVADPPGRVWLVSEGAGDTLHTVHVAAAAAQDLLLPVGVDDLRELHDEDLTAIRSAGEAPAVLVGDIPDGAGWQLEVIRSGRELPGGGLLLFEDVRMVALYGNPLTPVLGVLGEQDPVASVARARELAEPYGADGFGVLPAFEIIATVASSEAGGDGNYSNEMEADVIRPWVEVAGQ